MPRSTQIAGAVGVEPSTVEESPFALIGSPRAAGRGPARPARAVGLQLRDRRRRRRRAIRSGRRRTQRDLSGVAGPAVALCGAGMIAGVHAVAARELGLPIVGVASRTRERAAELAARVQSRPVDYDDLPGRRRHRRRVDAARPARRRCPPGPRSRRRGAAREAAVPHARGGRPAGRCRGGTRRAAAVRREPRLRTGRPGDARAGWPTSARSRRSRSARSRDCRRGARSRPTNGAAVRSSTSACIRSPSPCSSPARRRSSAVRASLRGGAGHGSDEHAELDLTFSNGLRGQVVSSWQAGPAAAVGRPGGEYDCGPPSRGVAGAVPRARWRARSRCRRRPHRSPRSSSTATLPSSAPWSTASRRVGDP